MENIKAGREKGRTGGGIFRISNFKCFTMRNS